MLVRYSEARRRQLHKMPIPGIVSSYEACQAYHFSYATFLQDMTSYMFTLLRGLPWIDSDPALSDLTHHRLLVFCALARDAVHAGVPPAEMATKRRYALGQVREMLEMYEEMTERPRPSRGEAPAMLRMLARRIDEMEVDESARANRQG
ncbi:hypothetical protein JCM10450v2_003505 [Rhodotorula kratochvilovae]